jgi:hypothetical protein
MAPPPWLHGVIKAVHRRLVGCRSIGCLRGAEQPPLLRKPFEYPWRRCQREWGISLAGASGKAQIACATAIQGVAVRSRKVQVQDCPLLVVDVCRLSGDKTPV